MMASLQITMHVFTIHCFKGCQYESHAILFTSNVRKELMFVHTLRMPQNNFERKKAVKSTLCSEEIGSATVIGGCPNIIPKAINIYS